MFNTRNANFTRSGLACILFQIAAISDRGPSRSFYPLRDPIFNHSSFEQSQARVGFSKSVQALGSSHLILQRRDSFIWNRILFGIGRAFFGKSDIGLFARSWRLISIFCGFERCRRYAGELTQFIDPFARDMPGISPA